MGRGEEDRQRKLWTSQCCSNRISQGKLTRYAKCATQDTVGTTEAASDTEAAEIVVMAEGTSGMLELPMEGADVDKWLCWMGNRR